MQQKKTEEEFICLEDSRTSTRKQHLQTDKITALSDR
jgi:hypothetical protein